MHFISGQLHLPTSNHSPATLSHADYEVREGGGCSGQQSRTPRCDLRGDFVNPKLLLKASFVASPKKGQLTCSKIHHVMLLRATRTATAYTKKWRSPKVSLGIPHGLNGCGLWYGCCCCCGILIRSLKRCNVRVVHLVTYMDGNIDNDKILM